MSPTYTAGTISASHDLQEQKVKIGIQIWESNPGTPTQGVRIWPSFLTTRPNSLLQPYFSHTSPFSISLPYCLLGTTSSFLDNNLHIHGVHHWAVLPLLHGSTLITAPGPSSKCALSHRWITSTSPGHSPGTGPWPERSCVNQDKAPGLSLLGLSIPVRTGPATVKGQCRVQGGSDSCRNLEKRGRNRRKRRDKANTGSPEKGTAEPSLKAQGSCRDRVGSVFRHQCPRCRQTAACPSSQVLKMGR